MIRLDLTAVLFMCVSKVLLCGGGGLAACGGMVREMRLQGDLRVVLLHDGTTYGDRHLFFYSESCPGPGLRLRGGMCADRKHEKSKSLRDVIVMMPIGRGSPGSSQDSSDSGVIARLYPAVWILLCLHYV